MLEGEGNPLRSGAVDFPPVICDVILIFGLVAGGGGRGGEGRGGGLSRYSDLLLLP